MLEAGLQKRCIAEAKKYRVIVRKVNCESRRGFPDLLLIFPISGETVYVEMKRPDGKGVLADLQQIEQKRIRGQNAAVYNCRSFKRFVEILEYHIVRIEDDEDA